MLNFRTYKCKPWKYNASTVNAMHTFFFVSAIQQAVLFQRHMALFFFQTKSILYLGTYEGRTFLFCCVYKNGECFGLELGLGDRNAIGTV